MMFLSKIKDFKLLRLNFTVHNRILITKAKASIVDVPS